MTSTSRVRRASPAASQRPSAGSTARCVAVQRSRFQPLPRPGGRDRYCIRSSGLVGLLAETHPPAGPHTGPGCRVSIPTARMRNRPAPASAANDGEVMLLAILIAAADSDEAIETVRGMRADLSETARLGGTTATDLDTRTTTQQDRAPDHLAGARGDPGQPRPAVAYPAGPVAWWPSRMLRNRLRPAPSQNLPVSV